MNPGETQAVLSQKNIAYNSTAEQFGSDIIFTSNGGNVMRVDSGSPTGASPLAAMSNTQVDWMRVLHSADGAVVNDTLMFTAFEIVNDQYSMNFRALTAGQANSILLATNFFVGRENSKLITIPATATSSGSIYINAFSGNSSLFRVDLQPGGVTPITLSSNPTDNVTFVGALQSVGNRLAFWTNTSEGYGLYTVASGQTVASLLATYNYAQTQTLSSEFFPVDFGSGSQILFARRTQNGSWELMSSDGVTRPGLVANLTDLVSSDNTFYQSPLPRESCSKVSTTSPSIKR